MYWTRVYFNNRVSNIHTVHRALTTLSCEKKRVSTVVKSIGTTRRSEETETASERRSVRMREQNGKRDRVVSWGGGWSRWRYELITNRLIHIVCMSVWMCVPGRSVCTSRDPFFLRRRRTPKSQTSPFGRRFIINHAGGCNECVCVRKRSVQTGKSVRAKTAAHQSLAYRFPTTPPSPCVSIRRRRNSIYYTFLFWVPTALPKACVR